MLIALYNLTSCFKGRSIRRIHMYIILSGEKKGVRRDVRLYAKIANRAPRGSGNVR